MSVCLQVRSGQVTECLLSLVQVHAHFMFKLSSRFYMLLFRFHVMSHVIVFVVSLVQSLFRFQFSFSLVLPLLIFLGFFFCISHNTGMLFVWSSVNFSRVCFWVHCTNTPAAQPWHKINFSKSHYNLCLFPNVRHVNQFGWKLLYKLPSVASHLCSLW